MFRVFLLLGAVGLTACAAASIPRQYTDQAEKGVTLTDLTMRPEAYREKVVILGGVLVDAREDEDRTWLLLKNRPLDHDLIPHLPADPDGPEGGAYWVVIGAHALPKDHQQWSRVTIVGRVTDQPPPSGIATSPVLAGMYVHGWDANWGGYGTKGATWEAIQSPNAILSAPKPVLKKE